MDDDIEKVFDVLRAFPSPSIRMIAGALGWIGPTGALDTFRVHRALLVLATDKLVIFDKAAKRWRVVKRKGDSGG